METENPSEKLPLSVKDAVLVYSAGAVNSSISQIAMAIGDLAESRPPITFVCILKGGIYLTHEIMRLFGYKCLLEFIQVKKHSPDNYHFIAIPDKKAIYGKEIILVDGIVDTGKTLLKTSELLMGLGAGKVHTAVLCAKYNAGLEPDFGALKVPNEWIFGSGISGLDGYGCNMGGLWHEYRK